jgi:hypothetical protein
MTRSPQTLAHDQTGSQPVSPLPSFFRQHRRTAGVSGRSSKEAARRLRYLNRLVQISERHGQMLSRPLQSLSSSRVSHVQMLPSCEAKQ